MQGRWRIRLEEPSLAASLEAVFDALAQGETPPAAEVVKRSRAREVLRLALATGEVVYLKHDRYAGPRWRPDPIVREFENLRAVRAAGFAAVEPLALAERGVAGGRERWLVTRALEGAVALRDLLQREPAEGAARLDDAAALARRLHAARFWHRDLHPGNVLVGADGLHLVDLQKLRRLPFGLPSELCVRDLVGLVGDGRPERHGAPARIAAAYCGALPGGPDPERFAVRLERAAARGERRRLASRGRRCVTDSTGFRVEPRGRWRVFHRRDVEAGTVVDAVAALGDARETRLPALPGGPPDGPARDPFLRGQGHADTATPAVGPALARRFGGGLAWPWLPLAHPGLRTWRLAHALLLRGVDTPAPLALVEERRLGFVSRSWLLTRCADDTSPLEVALAGAPERAERAGRTLAHWHRRGVRAAGLALRYRSASDGLVAARPEGARLRRLSAAEALRDLEAVAERLGPGERRALHAGYAHATAEAEAVPTPETPPPRPRARAPRDRRAGAPARASRSWRRPPAARSTRARRGRPANRRPRGP